MSIQLVNRHMEPLVEQALAGFRVVMIHGARQAGKTTLAQRVADRRGGTYISLDDDTTRRLVEDDPITFLSRQRYPLVVDEVQRGGDRLVRGIKQLVDAYPTPGRFLLTGSTNFLSVPDISESLAGRVRILHLPPLSEAELAGTRPDEINRWFAGQLGPTPLATTRDDYLGRICRGGYPEVVAMSPNLRPGWFESYIETITQRDIQELANIRKAASLPWLLRLASAATDQYLNVADMSRKMEISHPTATSYLEWLQQVFLLRELAAWSRSPFPRAVRRPKMVITDTGLAAYLLGVDARSLASPQAPSTGSLVETFVINEIARQLASSPLRASLFSYRDDKHEVDLVLESPDGAVVGVEIKASSSPSPSHTRHLSWMRDRLDRTEQGAFRAGILLHTGTHSGSLEDRIFLQPISALWSE